MVIVGETETDPGVAPPVEKLVPVHDVTFDPDHESAALEPLSTEVGDALMFAEGIAVYVSAAYS